MRAWRLRQLLVVAPPEETSQSFWVKREEDWVLVLAQLHYRELGGVKSTYAAWRTVAPFFWQHYKKRTQLVEDFLFNGKLLERLGADAIELVCNQLRPRWSTLWVMEMSRLVDSITEYQPVVPTNSVEVCTFVSEASGLQKNRNHPVLFLAYHTPHRLEFRQRIISYSERREDAFYIRRSVSPGVPSYARNDDRNPWPGEGAAG
jgi:hypothetical protein